MDSWIEETVNGSGYLGIILLMVIENVFPPVPSELIMPLAGYIVSEGQLTFIGIVLAGTAGSVFGAIPLYYLGYWLGEDRLRRFSKRHGHWLALSENDIDRSIRWFERHGGATVFFCRLIPGIRSLISIPAGFAHMRMPKFLLYTAFGTGLWAALLGFIGMKLGQNFDRVSTYVGPISYVVIGALVIWYVIRVIRQRRRRDRAKAEAEL